MDSTGLYQPDDPGSGAHCQGMPELGLGGLAGRQLVRMGNISISYLGHPQPKGLSQSGLPTFFE